MMDVDKKPLRSRALLVAVASLSLAQIPTEVHGFVPVTTRPTFHQTSSETRSLVTSPLFATDTETAADTIENPRKAGLSLMLDDGTRKSHSMAENTAFVSGFFKGLSTTDSFSALVTSLYFVYSAMESAFDATSNVSVQSMDNTELRRLASLEKDMGYFCGPEWKSKIAPSPATRAYVARVTEVATNEPYLLIAHQYTRYLGDLFGGQMMGGMASRSLGLTNGDGISFYAFDEIPNNKLFIDDWYTKLNSLDLTNEQKEAVVDEANLVFALNIGILEELEGSSLKAVWMLAINSLKSKLRSFKKS